MAYKVQVLNDQDRPTGETLKRSIAELLVRRLLADWKVPKVSIRRRRISEVNLSALPRTPQRKKYRGTKRYEHHLEPKIVPTTANNSQYQRYLEGWDWNHEQVPA